MAIRIRQNELHDEVPKVGAARIVSSCRTCRLIERDGELLVVGLFPNGTEMVYLSYERAALQREVEDILSGETTGDSGAATSEEPPLSESDEDTRSPEEASADYVRGLVREAMAIERNLPPAGEPPVVLDLFLGELSDPADLTAALEKVPTEPKHFAGATCVVSDLATLDVQAVMKWLEEASKALSEYNAQEGWAVSVQCAPRAYQKGQLEKMFPVLDSDLCNVSLVLRLESPPVDRPVAFGAEQEQLIDDIYMSGYAMRTVIEVGFGDGLDPDATAALVERIVRAGIATSLDFTLLPETEIPAPDELDRLYGLLDALYDRVYKSESYTTQDLAFFQDVLACVLGDPPWRRIAVSPMARAGMPPDQRRERIALDDYVGLKAEWTHRPLGCEADRCVHQSMCERRLPVVYYDLLRSGHEDFAGRIVRRNCQLVSKYGDKVVDSILEQCRDQTELSPPLMLVIGDDASVEYVPMPKEHRDQIEGLETPTEEGPKA